MRAALFVCFLLAGPFWCQPLPVILQPRCRDSCSNTQAHLRYQLCLFLTHPAYSASIPTLIPSPALQLPLPLLLTNNNRTKSPSFSSHPPLKTALSVMPTSYEVWLQGMQLAIAIVCRDDDRGGGTAESSQGLGGKGQRESMREKVRH